MLGSAEIRKVRLITREIIFDHNPPTLQTYGQTDGQTDRQTLRAVKAINNFMQFILLSECKHYTRWAKRKYAPI